ncbi:MAG TPA: M1 family aminopeptidase [Negativicutes bacterium]|nr:M1 family aminopeptidase [Negativicutes bacterium]
MFRKYFVPVLKVAGFITVYMTIMILAGFVLFSGTSPVEGKQQELLVGALSFAAALLVTFLYLRMDRKSFADIGSGFSGDWYKKLLRGCLEGIAAILTVFLILQVSGLAETGVMNKTGTSAVLGEIFAGLPLYLIAVAFTEELLTRGYIYHYLGSKFTAAGAVTATSVIFALIHLFNPNVTPLALVNIFLAGVVLNLLVIRDGKLWSAVGFHFAWNYIMGVIFASPVSGGSPEGIISISLRGEELLTGGAFGIEGGLVCSAILLLAVFYLLYYNNQREAFLEGFKGWKNRSLIGLIAIGALAYITYDILIWIPKPMSMDDSSVNSVSRLQAANDYTMKLVLDTNGKTVKGVQEVSFINNEEVPLSEAYFHIYPNAFKSRGGYIAIKGVKLNGNDSQYRIEGADSTLLYIPFRSPLEPGGRSLIRMEYEVSIPSKENNGYGDRFGYGDNTYNLGNFFPIAAVYGNGSWDKHLYDEKGDAFYSEAGNFDVELSAPAEQVIATSGYVESRTVSGGVQTLEIKAYSMRDFAFVASDMFRAEEAIVNGTVVKSYASSARKAKKVLEYGCEAIRLFNSNYGKYPYPTCSIAEADIGGGMEYPTLVMIEANEYGNVSLNDYFSAYFFGKPKGSLEFVVVHELAHQWWYGLVGNDEYREAWIDEPLTQYSTLEYYRQRYGQEAFDLIYERYIKLGVGMLLEASEGADTLNRPLDKFSEDDYTTLIYNKGTMMYKDLNDLMGDEKFDLFLRTLFERYRFEAVNGDEFISLASEIAGEDMSGFFENWLETDFTSDELY